MKKLFLMIVFLSLITAYLFSQNKEFDLVIKKYYNSNKYIGVEFKEFDFNSAYPGIGLSIFTYPSSQFISLTAISNGNKEIYLNKDNMYIESGQYSHVITDKTEEIIKNEKVSEIVFTDIQYEDYSISKDELLQSIKIIKECIKVVIENGLIVGSEKVKVSELLLSKSKIIIDNINSIVTFEDGEKVEEYYDSGTLKKINLDFIKRVVNGEEYNFYLVRRYKNSVYVIKYDKYNNDLDMNTSIVIKKPNSIKSIENAWEFER
jgi:hypothetical protein